MKGVSRIDSITITGLSATGYHGVLPGERQRGQRFTADVTLEVAPGVGSDVLSDTVDYSQVADQVVAVLAGRPRRLIETVAEDIAAQCLTHERVRRVTITVHKPEAPIAHAFADISVTISRSRHA